jgi:transcriptional regulator of acetoin/glycerol metabolism
MGGEDDVAEDDEAHRRREEGCRREEAIRSLLKRHDDKRHTIGAVEEIAQELGVSRSTMYRLITGFWCKRLRRGIIAAPGVGRAHDVVH